MPNLRLKLRKKGVDSYSEEAEVTRVDGFKPLDVLVSAKGNLYVVANKGQILWAGDKARGFVNLVETESEPEDLSIYGRLEVSF